MRVYYIIKEDCYESCARHHFNVVGLYRTIAATREAFNRETELVLAKYDSVDNNIVQDGAYFKLMKKRYPSEHITIQIESKNI